MAEKFLVTSIYSDLLIQSSRSLSCVIWVWYGWVTRNTALWLFQFSLYATLLVSNFLVQVNAIEYDYIRQCCHLVETYHIWSNRWTFCMLSPLELKEARFYQFSNFHLQCFVCCSQCTEKQQFEIKFYFYVYFARLQEYFDTQ